MIHPNTAIYVRRSMVKGAGRGVFASRNIKKGERIELCPVIPLSVFDTENVNESILVTYLFFYGKDKERALIALGFGSLYNHSYQSNATYTIHETEQTIEFLARTAIKKDNEITCDYTSGHRNTATPLWFE